MALEASPAANQTRIDREMDRRDDLVLADRNEVMISTFCLRHLNIWRILKQDLNPLLPGNQQIEGEGISAQLPQHLQHQPIARQFAFAVLIVNGPPIQ